MVRSHPPPMHMTSEDLACRLKVTANPLLRSAACQTLRFPSSKLPPGTHARSIVLPYTYNSSATGDA